MGDVFDLDGGDLVGPYDYTGDGIPVGVKDGGPVYPHDDLSERLTIVEPRADPPEKRYSGHATHVAGTIGASKVYHALKWDQTDFGVQRGMAPFVNLYSFRFNNDAGDDTDDFDYGLQTYQIRMFNNSWGARVGWYWDSDLGIWRDAENHSLFGAYSSDTEDWDLFAYQKFDDCLILVKSAGNDRNDGPDAQNHDGTYHGDAYYDCLPPRGCAKNVITVGAVDNNGNSAFYSSYGPTDDGRVKPDLVACGGPLVSTYARYYNAQWEGCWSNETWHPDPAKRSPMQGTSMSSPVITGTVALLFEAYSDYYGEYPTADTVKALLATGAVDKGRAGPDYAYGWGLAQCRKSIDLIENNYGGKAYEGGYISTGLIEQTGDKAEYAISISGDNDDDDLRVMLCWIDPAGDPSGSVLVNDLDLEVESPDGVIYYPYNLDPDDPDAPATALTSEDSGMTPDDPKNHCDTVEQVEIAPPLGHGTWTVRVRGGTVAESPQFFAVASTVGFDEVHFMNCKIYDGADWVPFARRIPDQTPDLRLAVFSGISGIRLLDAGSGKPEYRYSSNGGTSWSSWSNVDGNYTDGHCTQAASGGTRVGLTFLKVAAVPFDQSSATDNLIQFRVYVDGSGYEESPQFVVDIGDEAYVSASGSDVTGNGTRMSPWATIGYALSKLSASEAYPVSIFVEPGTYEGHIVIKDWISIHGREGSSSSCTLDGDGTNPTVRAANNATFECFEIKDGSHGVDIYNKENFTLSNCNIHSNGHLGIYGGGVYVYGGSNIGVVNCNIHANSAWWGGGMYVYAGSDIKVLYCKIDHNSAPYGAGVFAHGTSALIGSCMIHDNEAGYWDEQQQIWHPNYGYGGGLYLYGGSPQVVSCTLAHNIAHRQYPYNGGGIYNYGSQGTVKNCILWENGDDIYGLTATYSCIQDGDPGTGNIDDDPEFVDEASRDYHLKISSPCIDEGSNDPMEGDPPVSVPPKDFEGDDRIVDISGNNKRDMGADEYKFAVRSVSHSAGTLELSWQSEPGVTYTIQKADALEENTVWTTAGTKQATGSTTTWSTNISSLTLRFYRIKFAP